MDNSYSESDVSISPSHILERLKVLRQLQLLQQGKLQKHRLEYEETNEGSSSITEIVSQFSNNITSYTTFRSLLETPVDSSNADTSRLNTNILQNVNEKDLIDGVSVLNLSQESEYILNTTTSTQSPLSHCTKQTSNSPRTPIQEPQSVIKKHISLDEMPILSPKKDFEALVIEKLKGELNNKVVNHPKDASLNVKNKKQFLKRGQGTSRFGLEKKDFVIQNTKSLPWRKNSSNRKPEQSPNANQRKIRSVKNKQSSIEIVITESDKKKITGTNKNQRVLDKSENTHKNVLENKNTIQQSSEKDCEHNATEPEQRNIIRSPKAKHPVSCKNGKTWASVLSKEQNDFLQQLKQSEYYKNFVSPAKSTISDASSDMHLMKLRQEREAAEQNMFNLLENKVTHESFSLENSFFNRFLKRNQLESSGESTPLVLQHCITKNPNLMHILPDLNCNNKNCHENVEDTFNSECSDCCSETCSSVSSYCSCKTVEKTPNVLKEKKKEKNMCEKKINIQNKNREDQKVHLAIQNKVNNMTSENVNDTVNDEAMKNNMVEMNAKLIATSELLKDRLQELEDEIETFRQENANLTKMREEIDAERQKFYAEKAQFEQKFNEEKVLSEYYLAEEKEKLTKQKQMYDKYVREMRGRLNKKDKDEVVNLKKEINDLKEDMRLKDARTTSTIARLRNQIKILEKEKKGFEEEIEKLKKENRRIQHSNDITRRMTNLKYLEEINKKLTNMTTKDTQSEINIDSNIKYKAFEIEKQCRPKKVQSNVSRPIVRAKSVPNLKVTSRYAKYFSQRDIVSDMERDKFVNLESVNTYSASDNDESDNERKNNVEDFTNNISSDDEDENNLERMYMEKFHSVSPKSIRSNASNSQGNIDSQSMEPKNTFSNPDKFFISKGNSIFDSRSSNTLSPINNSLGSFSNRSQSPTSIQTNRTSNQRSKNFSEELHSIKSMDNHTSRDSSQSTASKSPISILTNKSSLKPSTVIHNTYTNNTLNLSPEPTSSRSSLTKTNLHPTEIKKSDGSRELRFPNGNLKFISADGQYSKFVYYNGDIKENFYDEGRIKYYYAETKTYHTTHPDGLEVLEFPDGQVEKRYKDGSTEIRLPNGSIRYFDPKNQHVREEWRFPDGTALTVSAAGEQRIVFSNGQVEVHAKDHKRREFPDGTVKLVYNDGTSETRYASGRVRIKDKHGNLIMDSSSR